jgi:hypothetical protein
MLDDKEVYSSIVAEFQLGGCNLKRNKQKFEALIKARMDICKLLKITEFKAETLYVYEKQFIINIDKNKSNIKEYQNKMIELNDQIKVKKQEIKIIKLHINRLEHILIQEKQESRKLREALYIFISREKFKIIKRLLIRKYRKVFSKYSNELTIKAEIVGCNKRKETSRGKKQSYNNTMDSFNKKITMDKKTLAQMRKNIINMQKSNHFFARKLQSLEDYKKMENKLRLEFKQSEKIL